MIFIEGVRGFWRCIAPPALRNPVEEFVPGTCEGEEPGAAIVKTERSAWERNLREGIFFATRILRGAGTIAAALQDRLGDFIAQVGGHRYSVAGVA